MPIPNSINIDSLVGHLEKEEEVEVEEILASIVVEGNKKYLVKWKGWPLITATFEPEENVENILENYPNLPDVTQLGSNRVQALMKIYKIPMYFKTALERALKDDVERYKFLLVCNPNPNRLYTNNLLAGVS